MSFLKKWAISTQQRGPSAPSADGKRTATQVLPSEPERGLPILPNELIPTVLTRLDSRSLFRIAQVSRRFNELATRTWLQRHGIKPSQLSSGHALIDSDFPEEAFAALRCALFLRTQPLTSLSCVMPSVVTPNAIVQLGSLISWFNPRLAMTELDFGLDDMIPQSTVMKPMARALTNLFCVLASDCPTTVFVLKDGLFTCRPDALRRWSPATGHYEGGWSESNYSNVRMHDGSRQNVPTIRSLHTLSVKYPLNSAAASPFDKWKLVVVDVASLTDLQLSIKLLPQEWAAILGALSLPALVCVGLWAEAINTATSTRFFNRHPKIRTIKYMSPAADAVPPGCPPLRLPSLETLNTLVPYLVHILAVPDDAASCAEDDASASDAIIALQRFPRLVHIELRPHVRLHEALLFASAHAPLRALTLWSLAPAHLTPRWPVFPDVRRLTLNESQLVRLLAAGLPGLIARGFPALMKVELNYSWANNTDISTRQMEKEQKAFVEQVRAANPALHMFLFDGKEYSV
ncbi:hypothetical protein C8F04DRAFT_1134054 [Mycena alexandri]|uniref:F-box domain-containing protein n=1 Tax=Mycena alexandri TaxID=1745969 RepID=A0AAD6WQQ9_9AGAR|nr:hypothetical protein C8F04DRAFT_1134054 [Mycena alexandri]